MGTANLGKAADFFVKEYGRLSEKAKKFDENGNAIIDKSGKQVTAGRQTGRKEYEKVEGQILVITKIDVRAGLEKFEKSAGIGKQESVVNNSNKFNKMWKDITVGALQEEAGSPPTGIVKDTIKILRETSGTRAFKVEGVPPIQPDDIIISIGTYARATAVKKNKGKSAGSIKAALDKAYGNVDDVKYATGAKDRKARGIDQLGPATFFEAGHGQFGIATSQIDVARAQAATMQKFGSSLSIAEKDILGALISEVTGVANLTIEHNMIVDDKAYFSNEFVPVLSLQDKAGNRLDAQAESAAIRRLRDQLLEIATDPFAAGSPSQYEAYEDALKLYFFNRFKANKNVRVNFKGKNTKLRDKGPNKRGSLKIKRKIPVRTIGGGTFLKLALQKKLVDDKKGQQKKKPLERAATDPGVLLGQLNKDLGQRVERNMGRPALRSDSGRFANSAQVLAVIPTRAGLNQIDYTYQKDPYQVFEGGYGYPSAFDPRKVIEKSIRELATRQLETKFVLRRV